MAVIAEHAFITVMETIKRQIRAASGCLVAGQSPWTLTCTARPYRLYARSVTLKRHCSCSMRLVALYKCYMCLPFARCMKTRIDLHPFSLVGAGTK